MTVIQQKTSGQQILLATQAHIHAVRSEWFSASFWQQQQQLRGAASGRGTAHFIEHEGESWVLRHYQRGGLVRHISRDTFVYSGIKLTRCWRELQLLAQMHHLGLPCPAPIAGRVQALGPFYRCDILIQRIPDASDVHSLLQQAALPASVWQHIGATIRRFHDKQVYHHDLNIHNILLDINQQAWLIDFDKCRIQIGEAWKVKNLERLLRSLNKEAAKFGGYQFTHADWLALLEGYRK